MTSVEFSEKIDRKQIKRLGELTNERSYFRAETILNAQEICPFQFLDTDKEGVYIAKCCATPLDVMGAISLSLIPGFLLMGLSAAPIFRFIGELKIMGFWVIIIVGLPFLITRLLLKIRRQHALDYVYEMKEKEDKINQKIETVSAMIWNASGKTFPKRYSYFNQLYLYLNLNDKSTTVDQYVEHLNRKYAFSDEADIALAGVDGKREVLFTHLEELFRDGQVMIKEA